MMNEGIKTAQGVIEGAPVDVSTGWMESPKKIVEFFKHIWDSLHDSIKLDQGAGMVRGTVQNPATAWHNRLDWLKRFWVIIVMLILSVFIVWKYILRPSSSRRYYRRGHHGINKYGRRY